MDQALYLGHSSGVLSIRADARNIRHASEWLGQFACSHKVPTDQIGRLDLCLNEALANVLSYGNDDARLQPIALTVTVEQHEGHGIASVTVSDAGPEFDVASAPLAERPQTLADAQPGGLGILMIRSFSDDLKYERLNHRNELTFSVRWELHAS